VSSLMEDCTLPRQGKLTSFKCPCIKQVELLCFPAASAAHNKDKNDHCVTRRMIIV